MSATAVTQLSVLPGNGVVARYGDVVLVALSSPAAAGAAVDPLIAIARALGSGADSRPGDVLVDRVATLLRPPGPVGTSFCLLAGTPEGLEVVLRGDLEIEVGKGAVVTRHGGFGADTWVDLVIDGAFDTLAVAPAGTQATRADLRLDLHEGVVPGVGVTVTRVAVVPGHEPVAPEGAAPPVVGETAPPTPPVRSGEAFEAVVLATVAPPARLGPLPRIETPGARPMVTGRACPVGHLNHPLVAVCATCGRHVRSGTALLEGPRPSLGVLALDDGSGYALDAGYVIGRDPYEAPAVREGRARPLVLDDPRHGVSPVHAEILLHGWDVLVVDRESSNGTFVADAAASPWARLGVERHPLLPGGRVLVGRRVFTYLAFHLG